jgi:hypothetical protein
MPLRGAQLWRSGGAQSPVEQISAPGPICLCYQALSEWHLGDTTSSQDTMAESIARAKELNDVHGLAPWHCNSLAFSATLSAIPLKWSAAHQIWLN